MDGEKQRQGGRRGRPAHSVELAGELARAFGGALLFALPMLMTMEMWHLGFYMDRWRLLLLLLLNALLLLLLSRHAGFEQTYSFRDDLRDAAIAYGVGIVTSAVVLTVLGVLKADMPAGEIAGKIALQSVPASIGALLARSQLHGGEAEPANGPTPQRYGSELFLMVVGALFLSLNVAPTEEMVLISYMMTEWHALALVALSLLLMHGFVYAMEFKGQEELPPGTPWWSAFLRFTVPGYALSLAISLYVLWTFERLDAQSLLSVVMSAVVLAFPAAIGAAAARLIL